MCVNGMNTCRLEAVLKWGSGRSDEATALLICFEDEDGYHGYRA